MVISVADYLSQFYDYKYHLLGALYRMSADDEGIDSNLQTGMWLNISAQSRIFTSS